MPDLKRKRSPHKAGQHRATVVEQTGQLSTPDEERSDKERVTSQLQEISFEVITIAIFCALAHEVVAVKYSLDEEFTCWVKNIGRQRHVYSFGRLGNHNVVIARPYQMGTVKAAQCAATVSQQFPNVRFALMVGIGAGIPRIPTNDVRLGDIAVSLPRDDHPGVIQYDFGKYESDGFVLKGSLNKPPSVLIGADGSLEEDEIMDRSPLMRILEDITKRVGYARPTMDDVLFDEDFHHVKKGANCGECMASSDKKLVARDVRHQKGPIVHRGLILSGNGVIKNPHDRHHLLGKYGDAICYEMEAAGIMDEIPCLVIRGICDYADTHKQDGWQYYASAVAAAYCKAVICRIDSEELESASSMGTLISETLRKIRNEQSHVQDSVDGIGWKLDAAKLPVAGGAFFDSYTDQHAMACLPGTRTELLGDVSNWVNDPNGKCIFWLNGMAGTGKSTISRTVAKLFAESKTLGASFFFKKGESERESAKRFFPTLLQQLVIRLPEIIHSVQKAIEDDPFISQKALGEQFNKLLLQPLLKANLTQTKTIAIVIDAMDECDSEENNHTTRTLLQLFPRVQASKNAKLRFFITSRPVLPIRLGFKEIESNYQALDLHNIADSEIAHDICLFLKHALTQIQKDHSLSPSWPGEEATQVLLSKTKPLFISAATLCRFIGDQNWNPQKRLEIILADQSPNVFRMDSIYLPVLKQLLLRQDEWESEQLLQEFKEIVGVNITLISPLSVDALSKLLSLEVADISKRLDRLHSVLNVPKSQYAPVRLLHLSFRDFLLSTKISQKFWIDEKATHQNLLYHCLEIMNHRLRRNICNLPGDDAERSEIDMSTIDNHLPSELRYACQHWVYHLKHSQDPLIGIAEAFAFLEEHFLHWVEALSILGNAFEILVLIETIQSITQGVEDSNISEFLYDASRFIRRNRQIVDVVPLQLYSSALTFAPKKSVIRGKFERDLPNWLYKLPEVAEAWGADLETLEHHQVFSLDISPNGQVLGSGSSNGSIKIWDTTTGVLQQTLIGCSEPIVSVAFSPDNQHLVSASMFGTIALWDTNTGVLQSTVQGHSTRSFAYKFSPDINHLAFGSDFGLIELRGPPTGDLQQTFEHGSDRISSMVFSRDSQRLASGSMDGTIKLWGLTTGLLQQFVEDRPVLCLIFSPQNQILTSASHDGIIRLRDSTTGALQRSFKGDPKPVRSMAFSPNDQHLALGFEGDGSIKLWDSNTGVLQQTLKGHSEDAMSIVFLPGSQTLASGSSEGTVKIWDISTKALRHPDDGSKDNGRQTGLISSVLFSPDGQLLASGSADGAIKVYGSFTGDLQRTLVHRSSVVCSMAFSPDEKLLASGGSDDTVNVWDINSGQLINTFRRHLNTVWAVAFSPDGQFLASGSDDGTIMLWDSTTGNVRQKLASEGDKVSVAFSLDGEALASLLVDKIELWDLTTGTVQKSIPASHMVGSFSQCSLSFLDTCLYVYSDQGSFKVDFEDYNVTSCATDTEVSLMEDRWVALWGKKVLWLPPDYRPYSLAIKGDTIVLGHESGRITIMRVRT